MAGPPRGACLCGACSFTAEPAAEAGICHCGMCRKWSGGMFIAVSCGGSVRFDDGAPVSTYVSSEWGERRFCATCGATLLWQMQGGQGQMVSVQCFDDPAQFAVTSEIFFDSKPASYALANETRKMTGAEVMAMFAPAPEDAS